MNTPPLDEREPDDEPTGDNAYKPWYLDHEAWHPYEVHDELGSGGD